MLTLDRLKELLDYNPETGLFTWKITRNNYVKSGRIAEAKTDEGYVTITVDGECWRGHRLAWFYVHGVVPDREIDHINCVKSDNRIANLRLATRSENRRNRGLQKNNKSGVKGVSWSKAECRWDVRTRINGKQVFIGQFDSLEEAAEARKQFCAKAFGEFVHVSDQCF